MSPSVKRKCAIEKSDPQGLKPVLWRNSAARLKAVPFPFVENSEFFRSLQSRALPKPDFETSCVRNSYFTLRVDSRTISSGTILR